VFGLKEKPSPALILGPDAAWFKLAGTGMVRIERRKHLRRLLGGLARAQSSPGGLSVTEMFELGWPGERAFPKAAATRVYTAIHALRMLGIGDLLVRRHDGYVLHAEVTWVMESTVPPPLQREAFEVLIPPAPPVAQTG
jgi:hypothetical protein